MNIVLRLAWRNIWRQPRRTWLTTGAMVFSNTLLVFMISLQFGMYDLMISNTLQSFSGHLQVQAPGYIDDLKMRQSVPDRRWPRGFVKIPAFKTSRYVLRHSRWLRARKEATGFRSSA